MLSRVICWLNRLEKKDKAYISHTHHFLRQFDRKNPKRSPAQLREIQKHRDIFNRSQETAVRW